jgi:ATP-dependent Clp protease ATP-binding subunit ClpA
MVTRLSPDARMVLTSAAAEARRRGDRRLGTDHLLLGLLHDPGSGVAHALGVDLETARTASESLDRAALAAVGVNVTQVGTPPAIFARRLPSLSSGARAVITVAVEQTRKAKTQPIQSREILLALLAREHPDPAAELLAAMGIERSLVRDRLGGSV